MKGRHYLKIARKSGWFTVYLHSEIMFHKQPLAKFLDKNDAIFWAEKKAKELKIKYDWEIK